MRDPSSGGRGVTYVHTRCEGEGCDVCHNTGEQDPPPVLLPGRNAACHCGSGRKYKRCCMIDPVGLRAPWGAEDLK